MPNAIDKSIFTAESTEAAIILWRFLGGPLCPPSLAVPLEGPAL
eukprot:CAMPEP_0196584118 /NCGR_PEP_ID=MMETSP1081-20130531/45837_1 /TAXON_ID=36882 /ORGANISM="Pyramimonas amylifera, Strain CCMP720" /LENGTH=43 /DNA_ID= /DNA_START= /DNA_END= /DNA_ORIENTATION=